MALFKGRDAEKLPLLTQFYQVEVPYPYIREALEGSELDIFLQRIEDDLSREFSHHKNTYDKNFLEEAAHIHGLIVALFDAMGIDDDDVEEVGYSVSPDTIFELEAFINKYIFSFCIDLYKREQTEDISELKSIVMETRTGLKNHYMQIKYKIKEDNAPSAICQVLKELHDLLLFGNKSKVRFCEECYSKFIQEGNRGGYKYFSTGHQRFCSRRCATRNGQKRRRYEKKHEELGINNLEDAFAGEDMPPPPPRLNLQPAVSLPPRPVPHLKKGGEGTLL